ncbi:gamma-glutamyltransferase family protein [Bradyrhizobium sp. sGM-13]|uniref:gamma-glutamyltransferase family protein n=1 Tax=Bradyrhizobium sp. sGM-13 TaxID=2831781 RepID=UPI001BD1270B|nr:gamma-glutamyltransferase family protein [Bradyrhizobium sp. sGM-13]
MLQANDSRDWPHGQYQHRGVAYGLNGAVSSAHPLATQSGLMCLRNGGNAIDALVTMAAVLSVVEPNSSGIGGVGYMIVAGPKMPIPQVLDFVGPSPKSAFRDQFKDPGDKDHGIKSAIVPGAIAGWDLALKRYGTITLDQALRPAIDLAESGFPVSQYLSRIIKASWYTFSRYETTSSIFTPNGKLPDVGDILVQRNLGRTLRVVAAEGARAFYEGSVADEIVSFAHNNGGLLSHDDLKSYEPVWQSPVHATFRDSTIYCPPPPCSGLRYLVSLNILAGVEDLQLKAEPDYLHYLIEAFKIAGEDTRLELHTPNGWQKFFEPSYASEVLRAVKQNAAAHWSGNRIGAEPHFELRMDDTFGAVRRESTTHLVAMDRAGYLAACTQTIGGGPAKGFGSGVVYGNTGILMNNFAHWFDWDPESPNTVGPDKKVEMCLAPSIIVGRNGAIGAIGTPGSWRILQTTPQMILNHLALQQNIQAAIEAPRFCFGDSGQICMEGRFSSETIQDLRRRGHVVEALPSWTPVVGGGHGIVRCARSGCLQGGADPRRDGIALAY